MFEELKKLFASYYRERLQNTTDDAEREYLGIALDLAEFNASLGETPENRAKMADLKKRIEAYLASSKGKKPTVTITKYP